jgi:hypothetical protein
MPIIPKPQIMAPTLSLWRWRRDLLSEELSLRGLGGEKPFVVPHPVIMETKKRSS